MNPEIPPPKVIIRDTSRRDRFIAIVLGVLLLGFVIYGIIGMGKPHESQNILVGEVVGKQFTPQKEDQVSFSGSRVEGVRHIEGEYVLKVRVPAENRTYDVPVEKAVYDSRRAGDKMEFVRPRSEQR